MNTNLKYKYAEEWLSNAVVILRANFLMAGYIVPPVHISVGFGTDGHKPNSKKHFLGVCYPKHLSYDEINEIYIAPFVTDPVVLIYTISHELIHAVDNCRESHNYKFKRIAKNIRHPDCGSLSEIERLQTDVLYRSIAEELGTYPRKGVKYEHGFTVPNPYYLERTQRHW
jgi:hypothetical protein